MSFVYKRITAIMIMIILTINITNTAYAKTNSDRNNIDVDSSTRLLKTSYNIEYNGIKYDIYKFLAQGNLTAYCFYSNGTLVTDEKTYSDLYKLYVMLVNYDGYKKGYTTAYKYELALVFGETIWSYLGKIATSGVIDYFIKKDLKSVPTVIKGDLKNSITDPAAAFNICKLFWASYKFYGDIYPEMKSMYTKTNGIKISKNSIKYDYQGAKITVDDLMIKYVKSLYKYTNYTKSLTELGLVSDFDLFNIIKKTFSVMFEGAIASTGGGEVYNKIKSTLADKCLDIANKFKFDKIIAKIGSKGLIITIKDKALSVNDLKNEISTQFESYISYNNYEVEANDKLHDLLMEMEAQYKETLILSKKLN